ncbi:hypothetical protein J2Q11_00940 [Tenacibaculum finnmarkense genomovar finnmarkense]|uniref:Uncharacterized protein n=1 Tax=Tenacibaculum finnmarkense genomovar finnmarkense TaxID=1458503 RepID=A0AAP1RDG8_9FLAO|nr:hypothetical protein [Tenacibaculum finnmarkense]MBE7651739.1 hypothetical protein [Tenacibaculum finnmarkense genomovar finnmarkense]MBE7659457.1 hypothetical protein [Tenacibaculum finnmarkense genomovar finnmarkense]MBE7692183.1 hypothetical protein [Tenacibaculum finnmarkense genomovar finnmarkense]MBE7693911.1 hypothetical protein [Tenacibaculum finnmarkense genomovar finnmarkense]MCD8402303.1 hypothetical protein [Tenacibaculum finnmarkense genomovar finnmarkense]
MDLEELLIETKSKAIFLLKDDGEVIDFFPKKNDLGDLQEKIIVFQTTLFNMGNHFFSTFFNTELKKIRLKSDGQNILMIKHHQYMLCFLSKKKINIALLDIILKKEFNNQL